MFSYEDLEAMENDEIDIFNKPKNKLRLRKCWFLSNIRTSDMDENGNLLYKQGYVVMQFLGTNQRKFIIPQTYNGLPIIGISSKAYDSIDEVVSAKRRGLEKYLIKVDICFYSVNMLFVFPPEQNIDLKHFSGSLDLYPVVNRFIEPTYYTNFSVTYPSKQTGDCILYYGTLMYPYANGGNYLQKIIEKKGIKKDYGFVTNGIFQYNFEVGPNKMEHYKIDLSQASIETFKDSYSSARTFYNEQSKVPLYGADALTKSSFKALALDPSGFGKQFGKAGVYSKLTAFFSKYGSSLAFVKKPMDKNTNFSFNTIANSDVTIDCDTQFYFR